MDVVRKFLVVAVSLLWVALAVHVLDVGSRSDGSRRTQEHEKTREVLGKKIDRMERILTDRQVDDAERLVKSADAHVYVLTNVSTKTERFGVSLHSARQWGKECDLLLKDGPTPPAAKEGSKPVIDYYNERATALRAMLARD